jgi:hypothetical protein
MPRTVFYFLVNVNIIYIQALNRLSTMFLRRPIGDNGLSEMDLKVIKALKTSVLYPDELEIVDVVGENTLVTDSSTCRTS